MTGLRITAGALKGRKVAVPPTSTRPTSSKARQAFFDILGPRIHGAVFLDLFSGSGIFSLEAISRGAAAAIAIDRSPRAIRQIRSMATDWNLPITPLLSDVIEGLARPLAFASVDVVYADPPYDWPGYGALLEAIDGLPGLSADAVVAIEHRSGTEPFRDARCRFIAWRRTARYGEVSISLFERVDHDMEERGDDEPDSE